MAEISPEDIHWMQRAIALARLSEGHTRPNPPVGAVVVKEDRIIGEGRHEYAGGVHAEVAALDSCAESPEGGTIYVTLEPCSTHGRTPPCTDRIIRERLKRVVIGCEDRYEAHCGRARAVLEESGIEVQCGVCPDEALELCAPFFRHVASGMPYVTLKLGMTLDGCVADRHGTSKWITGEESRMEVQRLRRRADAVMVGSGTVFADDPSLLCRLGGGGNLMRVIIDSKGTIPSTARVFCDDAAERTVVFTSVETDIATIEGWRGRGSAVELLKPGPGGFLSVREILQELGSMNLMHVLCEGGGGLAAALHSERLVDEYVLFYAPEILADISGRRAFASSNECLLNDMKRLDLRDVRIFGSDVCIRLKQPA